MNPAVASIIVALIGFAGIVVQTLIAYYSNKKIKKQSDISENIDKKIIEVSIDICKNYLVDNIAAMQKGEALTESQKERFFEEYDKYTNEYHQNSYIHSSVEALKKEGKL